MDKLVLPTGQTESTVRNAVLRQEIPAEHASSVINHEKKITEKKKGVNQVIKIVVHL